MMVYLLLSLVCFVANGDNIIISDSESLITRLNEPFVNNTIIEINTDEIYINDTINSISIQENINISLTCTAIQSNHCQFIILNEDFVFQFILNDTSTFIITNIQFTFYNPHQTIIKLDDNNGDNSALILSSVIIESGRIVQEETKTTLFITNCIFTQTHNYDKNNFDDTPGDGGYIETKQSLFIIIKNTKFENCVAEKGGCIYSEQTENILIKNASFTNCLCSEEGGCIDIIESESVEISDTYLSNGEVFDDAKGGMLYSEQVENLIINNCQFMNGIASDEGGCAYIEAGDQLIITQSTFISCSAYDSGCLAAEDYPNSIIDTVTLQQCVAGGKGGGMRVKSDIYIVIALFFASCFCIYFVSFQCIKNR